MKIRRTILFLLICIAIIMIYLLLKNIFEMISIKTYKDTVFKEIPQPSKPSPPQDNIWNIIETIDIDEIFITNKDEFLKEVDNIIKTDNIYKKYRDEIILFNVNLLYFWKNNKKHPQYNLSMKEYQSQNNLNKKIWEKHLFIQYLFPTDTPSRAQPTQCATLFTLKKIVEHCTIKYVQDNLTLNAYMFLKYLDDFFVKSKLIHSNWQFIHSNDHNISRISRVILSLRLFNVKSTVTTVCDYCIKCIEQSGNSTCFAYDNYWKKYSKIPPLSIIPIDAHSLNESDKE